MITVSTGYLDLGGYGIRIRPDLLIYKLSCIAVNRMRQMRSIKKMAPQIVFISFVIYHIIGFDKKYR